MVPPPNSFEASVAAVEQRLVVLERACASGSSNNSESLSNQVQHIQQRSSSLLGSIPVGCSFARAIARDRFDPNFAINQLNRAERAAILSARAEELKQALDTIERIPKELDGRAVIPAVKPLASPTGLASEISQLAVEFDQLAARSVRLTAEIMQRQIRAAEEGTKRSKSKATSPLS